MTSTAQQAPTVGGLMPARVMFVRRLAGRGPSLWIGVTLLALIILACIFVPVFWSYGPNTLADKAFLAPSLRHPFGTDDVGRDVFVRCFAAGRLDLTTAALTAAIALLVGTFLGTLAGATRNRWLDATIMRVADAVRGIPLIILLLAIVVVIGPTSRLGLAPAGLAPALIALVSVQWTVYARLARGQAVTMRESDFVMAARISGLPERVIVRRHLLPGIIRISFAYAIGDAVLVVVILASLPFVGVGVQPPTPEWGSIMFSGRAYLNTSWWITLLPAVILALTGLAASLIGDAILAGRDGT
jgi:peptide/nickel transport system permease protein